MKLDVDEVHEEGGTSVAAGNHKRGLAIGQRDLPRRRRGCTLRPSLFCSPEFIPFSVKKRPLRPHYYPLLANTHLHMHAHTSLTGPQSTRPLEQLEAGHIVRFQGRSFQTEKSQWSISHPLNGRMGVSEAVDEY